MKTFSGKPIMDLRVDVLRVLPSFETLLASNSQRPPNLLIVGVWFRLV